MLRAQNPPVTAGFFRTDHDPPRRLPFFLFLEASSSMPAAFLTAPIR